MTILVASLAIVAPLPEGPAQATFHPLPCDRACRRHVRLARRQRRQLARYRRYIAPYRSWLRSTRMCESHGNYRTATGNGYFGAYQFSLSTWASVGGRGFPHLARPLEQDYRAVRLLRTGGPGHWPVCG